MYEEIAGPKRFIKIEYQGKLGLDMLEVMFGVKVG